jgi:hypothetical protein
MVSGVYSMSAARGKRVRRGPEGGSAGSADDGAAREDATGRVPDLLRRVVGLGFSGFFLTEEVLRKTLGENLPKDWVDFAAAQSERTRRELIDRVAGEVGRTLDKLDLPQLAERLLRGHSIEVSAQLRFVPRESRAAERADAPTSDPPRGRALRVSVTESNGDDEEAP